MANYVSLVLQLGEQVTFGGRLHWVIYLPAWICFVFAIVGAVAASMDLTLPPIVPVAVGGIFGLVGVFLLIPAALRQWGTELVVTDKRVIYKTGLICRRTQEMNLAKVESVFVDQSIFGRMLGYGDVSLRGTGSGWEPLRRIAKPLQFRNVISGA